MSVLLNPPKVSRASSHCEARVLTECMIDASVVDYVISKGITPDHFGVPRHRRIWLVFLKRHGKGLGIHAHAMLDAFQRDQEPGGRGLEPWDALGGIQYVLNLAIPSPTSLMLDRDIAELQDALMRREVHRTLADEQERLGDADTNNVRERVIANLMNLKSQSPNRALSRAEITAAVTADLEAELAGDRRSRLQTGIEEIDRELLGVSTDGMTLLLAMSGHGKSSMVYRIALGLASQGHAVHLHGTERSAKQIRRVLAHSLSGQSPEMMEYLKQNRHVVGNDVKLQASTRDVIRATHRIGALPLEITGQGWTAERVAAYAKLMNGIGKCDVLIVDYLQDLSPSSGVPREGLAQTAHKSRTLKDLAAELGIPCLVTAQVSGEKQAPNQSGSKRGTDQPYNPRPRVHSCQWSSQVHQDAEEVWGLFNPDAYRKHNAAVTIAGNSATIEVEALKRRQGGHRQLGIPFHGATRWVGGHLELPQEDYSTEH